MHILSVDQMRSLEATANAGGYSYSAMMESAGTHIADVALSHLESNPGSVVVLVGPGNNGGDGLVAARLLAQSGVQVNAWLSRPLDENATLIEPALQSGVKIAEFNTGSKTVYVKHCQSAKIIIDALLGTGAVPPLRENILSMLETANNAMTRIPARVAPAMPDQTSRPFVIAVDGPSGLDFDTGEIDLRALHADCTVTFAAPKWGHILGKACDYTGELIVADIGIPDEYLPKTGPELATPAMIQSWLPQRSNTGHKGSHGKVLIAAGSANYTGAAILASLGAYRAGAGLVTLALADSLHSAVVSAIPEATYVLLPESLGTLNERSATVLQRYLEQYDSLLVGPGLSNTAETDGFLSALLSGGNSSRRTGFLPGELNSTDCHPPFPSLVLDADGLNIVSEWDEWWDRIPPGTILTPHPGEMARLTGYSIQEIQANRLAIADAAAKEWGHIVVLKGAYTVITRPDGEPLVSPFATSALATAGSGDVLAGIIAAMLAQGCEPFRAAVCGVYAHALAGTLASHKHGKVGVVARDIADFTGTALQSFE